MRLSENMARAGAELGFGNKMPGSSNQWYVAISRARQKAVIVTGDKEALRLSIAHASERKPALSIKPTEKQLEKVCEAWPKETRRLIAGLESVRLHESVQKWVQASALKERQQQQAAHQQKHDPQQRNTHSRWHTQNQTTGPAPRRGIRI